MKNRYLVSLFIIYSILFTKCDVPNTRLLMVNNTNKAYYYRLLADTADLTEGTYLYNISANDSVRPLFVRGGNGTWEYQINRYSPDSTLNIYLFDAEEVINNKLTPNIIQQKKFKKLTYKVQDLEKLQWKIVIH